MAQRLLAQLPKRALLLGDRLYGVAAFVVHARAACTRVGSHFLLRASRSTKPRVIRRLRRRHAPRPAGAARAKRPDAYCRLVEVREIRVRVRRKGHRGHELRLWTSLLDPRDGAAIELAAALRAALGARAVFPRAEMPRPQDRRPPQSHGRDGGPGNCGAGPGQRLLAAERLRAAGGQLPVLRVSFTKILERASNRCGSDSTWGTAC